MLNMYTGKKTPDDEVIFYDGFLYIIMDHRVIEDGEEHSYEGIREICLCPQYDPPLSLADIKETYPDVHIVIHDDALYGEVYKYGNHTIEPGAEAWELYGETRGYA